MAVSPPRVELVVRRKGQPERRVLLGMGTTQMGRAEDNDLVLADIGVSRRHARIVVDVDGVTVEDAGSGNGTWFRGARIERQVVGDGDEVVIEPFTLHFQLRSGATLDRAARPPKRADDGNAASLTHDDASDAIGTGARPPDARIVTLSGQRLAESYTIFGQRLTMGRSQGRDVVLFDPAASRRHCELVSRGGEYWLVDVGSANGTFVNTKRVRECLLAPGDRIRIGTTEFRFERAAPRRAPRRTDARQSTTPMSIPIRSGHGPRGRGPIADRPTASRSASRPPGRSAARIAAQFMLFGAVAGFLLMVLVAVVVAFNWDRVTALAAAVANPASPPAPLVAGRPPPPSDPAVEPRTSPLLDEGMVAFQQGRYLDAAAQFYKVLQLDPANPQAERMGYVACEYIALDTMRDTVSRRTVPEPEQVQRYNRGLALASDAVKGKASLADARAALHDALVFFPDDENAASAYREVLALESSARETERIRAHKRRVEKLYKLARMDADRGNHIDAVVAYEGVMAADPDKRTHYYYDARDGISASKARLAALAEPELKAGDDAAEAGDTESAKQRYTRALELDPYNETARAALSRLKPTAPAGSPDG